MCYNLDILRGDRMSNINREDELKLANYLIELMNSSLDGNLSFDKYEEYCKFLKKAISSDVVEDPSLLANILLNASVVTGNKREEVKYGVYERYLKSIIAREVRKTLGGNGSFLKKEIKELRNRFDDSTITLYKFYSFCEKVNLALIAQLGDVDYVSCLHTLQTVKIYTPKSADEYMTLQEFNSILSSLEVENNDDFLDDFHKALNSIVSKSEELQSNLKRR